MGRDRARRSPKKRGKFHNYPMWPHAVLPRKQEMERQHNKSIRWELRVAELVLRITDRYQLKIVQVYAPTTSHSDAEAFAQT